MKHCLIGMTLEMDLTQEYSLYPLLMREKLLNTLSIFNWNCHNCFIRPLAKVQ